jgi:hypothetical protein
LKEALVGYGRIETVALVWEDQLAAEHSAKDTPQIRSSSDGIAGGNQLRPAGASGIGSPALWIHIKERKEDHVGDCFRLQHHLHRGSREVLTMD